MDANDRAVQAIRAHHAALLEGLRQRSDALFAVSAGGTLAARSDLLAYLSDEILPHAEAEETTIYRRGHDLDDLRLLLDAMLAEHARLRALAGELANEQRDARAAAVACAITELFALHADKENDLLLPRLAREPGIRVHDLLGEMHELLEG